MKFLTTFACLLFFQSAIASHLASECREITYSATDFEFVVDHDDMNTTCLAAGKSALWAACVNCAANAKAGDSCRVGFVKSTPDEASNVCYGLAEARLNVCAQNLVHCVDIAFYAK